MTSKKLDDFFRGERFFLSNFYSPLPEPIKYLGFYWNHTEGPYQAAKCMNSSNIPYFVNLSPERTKVLGRKIVARTDWNKVRIDVMCELIHLKFSIPLMREQLVLTGEEELVEGNYWHDNFWGSCVCEGCKERQKLNWLGRILMEERG